MKAKRRQTGDGVGKKNEEDNVLERQELVVQRLSSEVAGKAQKYTRVGPREFVKKPLQNLKSTLWRAAIHKILLTTHSQRFEQRTQALLQRNETRKTNLALHKTIPPGSSKSQRNLNEEVVPYTATTIAKSNLQGAPHNIIQRRPNHVFRSHVGLSTILTQHIAVYSNAMHVRLPTAK